MRVRIYHQLPLAFLLIIVLPGFAQDTTGAAPPDPEIVVPAGTDIPIVLTTYLNSRNSNVGDTFYAETIYPIWIQQRMVIPRGSVVKGTVTEVVRPGRIKGKGRMAIRIDSILLPNGVSRNLVAAFRGIHGPGTEKLDRQKETVEIGGTAGTDVGTVAGTAASGAMIGAIADRGRGAGIGAGVGGAVGLATVLLSRGRDLVLEPGTQFDIELKQPVRYAYGELEFSPAHLNDARRSIMPRPSRNQRPGGAWPPNLLGRGLRRIFPWP